jgi:hypothetical protein
MANTLDLLGQRYGHTDGLSGAGALKKVLSTIFSHRAVRRARWPAGRGPSQELANPVWSEHSRERLRAPDSPRGRDRLKQALHGLGFELR